MGKQRNWWYSLLLILPMIMVAGCGNYGGVDQGRAIKFDKEKRVMTIIRDVKADPQSPDYNHLPPVTYLLPSDPNESGAEPKVGLRMKLDTQKRQIVIYDPDAKAFQTIDYTLITHKENVDKNDPLVKDKKFPAVDREKKTITVSSGRQKILTTFSLPDEYFSKPDNTWDAGDEVRVYFKEEGKAQRYMNISKTDIYKK